MVLSFPYLYIYFHIAAYFNSSVDIHQDNTQVCRATALIAVRGAGRVLQSKVTNDYLGIGLAGRRRQPHLRGGVCVRGWGREREM